MTRSWRWAAAVVFAAAVVLSAPFSQQIVEVMGTRLGSGFRRAAMAATVVPVVMAFLVAVARIRDRRVPRYTALAVSAAIGLAYAANGELLVTEAFHFVEYGVIGLLFYRAVRRREDATIVVIPLLAGLLAGIADEWFQWFIPFRAGEARDIGLNGVATLCGLMIGWALAPPPRMTRTLRPESLAAATGLGAAVLVALALFVTSVHLGYEIRDDEVGSFVSRYSAADLQQTTHERAEQWRTAPPVARVRLSREDQYLTEALWHVRRRNKAWDEGNLHAAWLENRILEKFYAPVLDTPTFESKQGTRWPSDQRAAAAARAPGTFEPYVSDAYPYPFYALPFGQAEAPADRIIDNARVYTMDPKNPTAEAIAIRGDRIARVGSRAAVMELRGPGTRVVDAGGSTIVPGLHDAHGHFANLGASLLNLDLRGTTGYQQIVDLVRERVATARPGEWITGRGWDQNDWAVKDWPTHDALSAVSPGNPVYLTRVDGHAALVNRRALEIAGLTRAARDPDGGRIIRTAAGDPAGVLIDRAQEIVSSKIPPASDAQLDDQILRADREVRRLGLTAVHDAGTDARTIDAYKRLIDAGQLKTRLYVMVRGSLDELKPFFERGPLADYGNHHLAVRAIKVYADGALGSRGAAMLEPYADEPGTSGLLTMPPGEVYAQTLAASKAGFQTNTHAIGDRANRIVLDTYERVQREVPGARDLRLRVEHAQILDAADIPRFARLGIIASMQPTHATSDMPWVPARIGRARMEEGAYVWQKLLKSGARLASGSDFPVEEPNPMLGLYAAVTRQDPSGNPAGGWMPAERLSREEAVRSFTIDAAYAAHAESWTGSLQTGKVADLIMLSNDILRIPPQDILTTTVRFTMVGGEVVYP
jgi:predicted amidohydrolase YtcJ/VanZ family protein